MTFKSKKETVRRETYISFAVKGKSKNQEAVNQKNIITSYTFVREPVRPWRLKVRRKRKKRDIHEFCSIECDRCQLFKVGKKKQRKNKLGSRRPESYYNVMCSLRNFFNVMRL